MREVKFGFVKRIANGDADRITKQTVRKMFLVGWVFQLPSSFVYVLNNDGLPSHQGSR